MTKIIDGGSAFPLAYTETNEHGTQFASVLPGMSLRDWFAGQFLAGAAAGNDPLDVSVAADRTDVDAALEDYWNAVARAAYIAADAIIAAREGDAS